MFAEKDNKDKLCPFLKNVKEIWRIVENMVIAGKGRGKDPY